MGLFEQVMGRFRPEKAPVPDVSHIHGQRVTDISLFDTAQVRASRPMGVTDSSRPSQHLVQTMLRSTFARCIQLRADAIAQAMTGVDGDAPDVVRRRPGGAAEPVEDGHPWRRLIERPNPYRSAFEVWHWASMARDLQGSADFIVEHDGRGMPIAMYEVFADFGEIRPVPDAYGGVAGYKFWRKDGAQIDLEAKDVIRFRRPDPTTPWESVSLLEWAAYSLDIELYAQIYQRDQMKDGRTPPAYLSTTQRITPAQAKQYGEAFQDGYMKAGEHTKRGVPVLGNDLEIKTTSLNANDLALIDSRRLNDTHIFWATGVPQGLLSDDANRANADAARKMFERYTIQPETVGICAQLTRGFETSFGAAEGVLNVRPPDVVSADPLEQSRVDEIRIRTGLDLVNELRDRDGLDPVDGGDIPLISAGLQPLADAGF